MKNDPDRSGVQKRRPGQFCCTEQVWAAQDESGVSVAMCITEDDTPLSIPDEETPPSGNAGTGFWSILFQLLKHLAQRQKESPDYYERLPELNGRTGWQQLDTTLCMRVLLDPEKDAARPLDLLGSTPHPAAARRACNAVRMARNEAAHASDRTAAAQAAIRFNEAVEELEAGYEGTALTTGDLEKYYRMAEDFLSRCGASETIEPQKKAEDEAPRRQKSQKSGSTSRKRQSGGSRTTSKGTSGRSRNASGRNSRSRQNMQTTARRKKRQRTQSRALTVVLLAVVLLGLLVRAWTMGLMK